MAEGQSTSRNGSANPSGVYKVNQNTGEVTYEGPYEGRGGQSVQNAIRTVGARQALRTARAFGRV